MAKWPNEQINSMVDGERYRRLQAKELLQRFKEAHGRPAADMQELSAWVAAGGGDEPIRPRQGLTLEDE